MPWLLLLGICLVVIVLAFAASVFALVFFMHKRFIKKLRIRMKLGVFEWEIDGER